MRRRADLEAAKLDLARAGFLYRQVAGLGSPGGIGVFLDGPDASIRDAVHIVAAGQKVCADSLLPAPNLTEAEDADRFRGNLIRM